MNKCWFYVICWTLQASNLAIAMQYITPMKAKWFLDLNKRSTEQDGQTDIGPHVTSIQPPDNPMHAAQGHLHKADIQRNVTSYLGYIIGNGLEKYAQPSIVCIGLVGNTISLLIMLQEHNRQLSCCIYMGALAITDNLFLLVMFHQWVSSDIITARYFTRMECKALCAIFIMLSFSSIFIVLSMTFDRFLAVCYPLHAASWCTARRAKITIVVIIITMFFYSIPVGLYSDMIDSKRCAILIVKNPISIVYSWLGIVLGSAVPYTVIITLNVSIIKAIRGRNSLFHNDKHRVKHNEDLSRVDMKDQNKVMVTTTKDMQLTIMLLSVTFTLIILTLPQNVRYIVFIIVDPWQSVKMYSTYVFLYNFTNKLYSMNSAINFFLYCISGTKFQKDVRTLFCGRKHQSS